MAIIAVGSGEALFSGSIPPTTVQDNISTQPAEPRVESSAPGENDRTAAPAPEQHPPEEAVQTTGSRIDLLA